MIVEGIKKCHGVTFSACASVCMSVHSEIAIYYQSLFEKWTKSTHAELQTCYGDINQAECTYKCYHGRKKLSPM